MPKEYPSYGTTLSTFSKTNKTLTSENDEEIRKLMAAHGIQNKRENNLMYEKFSRIHAIDPYNAMTVTREYLFFTKPDLHLMNLTTGNVADSLSKYAFFKDAIDRYRIVCEQLQFSIYKNSDGIVETVNKFNPFITLLSNTVTSELELPDIEAENELESGANVYGTKISYRGNSYPSDQEHTFSLEFEDTKYLEVYMFFKIWDEYCRMKNMGLIELTNSKDDLRWVDYTWKKILHDQIAVYKFVVGEDGHTLVYWAKYTGVYPTNVPRSALSNMNNSDGQKLTVNFKAQFVRDMDPVILGDFNTVALGYDNYTRRSNLPIFDPDLHTFNGTWSTMPFIAQIDDSKTLSQVEKLTKYRLLWKA